MMKKFFALYTMMLLAWAAMAQVTTTPSPIDKGYTGQVVITFDPTGGNGGMATATKCYAHTGLITSESKSSGDWKNVVSSGWRSADTPELTKVGNKWTLTIPNIYTFYGVPETTDITALAFVFHDGPGGSKEGKTTSGGDILVYLGEESVADIWDGFTPAACQTAARPSGVDMGFYYDTDQTKVTLCTYAASKTEPAQHVFLIGDMTDWKLNNAYQLKRDGNYFWITLENLTPGQQYRFQYAVVRADGVKKQVSDAFAELQLHPDDAYEPATVWGNSLPAYPIKGADGGYVSVFQTGKTAFSWSNETLTFQRPDKNNLIIYELWVYDYTPERSFAGLMHRLDYLQALGVNAVELMPVCEFDGNYNWGYSPNHYFAPDKAYGSPEQLKTLVDECHKRGMAVIMDMVFNHATGLNPQNKLYPYGSDLASNPWFNASAPHSDNVYEDWNHDFEPAHRMFVRALNYWLTEYKVDGYRMDLSHGFCGADCSNLMSNLSDYYTNGVQAVSPGAYFILEHWGSGMGTQRPQLVNQGMLCWSNTNNAYSQTAMGWLQDGDGFTDANKDGYVSYCESHDEERNFYKAKKWGNGLVKTDEDVRLGRIAANVAFNVLLNGPHMIWQYEEVGYDFSINSSDSQPAAEDSGNRCSKKPRPEQKGYFNAGIRMQQYKLIAAVCHLRTRLLPAVFEGNPTDSRLGSGQALRYIQWGTGANAVYAVANFSAADNQAANLPTGTWYDYLNGGAVQNAGTVVLAPGELRVFTAQPLQAPAVPDSFGDFTALDYISGHSPAAATKVLRNGHVFILRDGACYTVEGMRVE